MWHWRILLGVNAQSPHCKQQTNNYCGDENAHNALFENEDITAVTNNFHQLLSQSGAL